MKPRTQHVVSILLGLITIAGLGVLSQSEIYPSNQDFVIWGILTALIFLTSGFGIPLGGGEVSMAPLIALTGALVLGVIPAAWSVICGEILYGFARFFFPARTGWPSDQRDISLVGTTAANVTMHGLSMLAAGSTYLALGGEFPAETFSQKLIFVAAGAAFIITNYLTASLFILMRGKPHLVYLWKNIPRLLLYEAIPLIFVPLSAQLFILRGVFQFFLFAISLSLIAYVLHDQAKAHKVLQRRIQELDSLQAVGQALSSSLDIKIIAEAVYTQVSKLMPATNFYVALYNNETAEVTFPVVYEHGVRKEWPPRVSATGLTEFVIEKRQPLLIEKGVKQTVQDLGVEHRGEEALSWLGVPILAGEKVLGMIAVQSYPRPNKIHRVFDQSHQEILTTIAAQASVAIQNAQLFTKTDQTLELRVQELSSILSTTHEGILLLDADLRVVEANRALSNILNEPVSMLRKATLTAEHLSAKLGFNPGELEKILHTLSLGEKETDKAVVTIGAEPAQVFRRTLSPVRSESGRISGWLIVFRDLTEEIHLTQLREDLTRMLVHDLRSPMVTIQGGLDLIEMMIRDNESKEELLEMLKISRRGSEQMMGMINELLSIHKFESGQLELNLEPISLTDLILEVNKSFTSVLQQANLTLTTNFSPGIPILLVDREMIRRLIHNLLDNAIKFTPDGGKINCWAKMDPEDEHMVMFGIQDNGIGIPPETQALLFQKYFSSQDTKSRRKGTGIGLYFSKLAVQAHGGDIAVDSEPGVGSNFIIRMPAAPPVAAKAE